MTAEIAVINKSAVAVAADSAATIGGKVLNSAMKIFALSRQFPIAVMVYGEASFMGVPWETLIKMYREDRKDCDLLQVKHHAEDFFKYLEEHPTLFSKEYCINYLEFNLEIACKEFIRHANAKETSKTKALNAIGKKIDQDYQELLQQPYVRGFSKERYDQYYEEIQETVFDVIDESIADFVSSDRRRKRLSHVLVMLLTKEWADHGRSGLVFTGFGSGEHFPSLYSFETRGLFGGVVWRCGRNEVRIDHKNSAAVVPFAQTDVVKTFIDGIDPEMWDVVQKLFVATIKEMKRLARSKKATEFGNEILKQFFEEFEKFQLDKHIAPMLDMIGVLPKDELAKFAESLVSITSMKRHVTEDLETVGGPTDVAVISKGDGLIWIDRKHYFDSNLNPDYFSRTKLERSHEKK